MIGGGGWISVSELAKRLGVGRQHGYRVVQRLAARHPDIVRDSPRRMVSLDQLALVALTETPMTPGAIESCLNQLDERVRALEERCQERDE